VVSIDGTQNNFLFTDSSYINTSGYYGAYFFSKSSLAGESGYPEFSEAGLADKINLLNGDQIWGGDSPQNGTWLVTNLSACSIPDTGTTVAMLGSALVGLAMLRRRLAA
jgi:hypothetical protein